MEIKVFVSNLAKYNNGELNGEWTTLPVSDVNTDILDKLELGGDSEKGYNHDWFISDYEAPFEIGEHDNLYKLNELAESLNDYDSIEDVYWEIEDKEAAACEEVWDFNNDFFDTFFENRLEVARAVFFGNIQNWQDPYIYLNVYGNCETMNDYQFHEMLDDNANEIINQFKKENL